jgi:hypothetical protein
MSLLASTAVGAVYYYAAWFKLVNQTYFQAALVSYGFLPNALVPTLAWVVPCLEMAVGVSLLFSLHRRLGLVGGTLMAVMFTIVVFFAYLSGESVDCGCLVQGEKVSGAVIVRAALLLVALLMVESNPVSQVLRRVTQRRNRHA